MKINLICLLLLVLVACGNQSKTTKSDSNSATNSIVNDSIIQNSLFSTFDLEKITNYKYRELVIINQYDTISNSYDVYNLPIKIGNNTLSIITSESSGDWYLYSLCVIRGDTIHNNQLIDISPIWESPVESEDLKTTKFFYISNDFKITIMIKETNRGIDRDSTKVYDINNDGDFCEIK